jgi:8-oxo-dGTP diphosphatase
MTENKSNVIIGAAYLVLEKDSMILLQKRLKTGYEDGNYGLIGGHVEVGESFEDALIRESKEEAGIEILTGDAKVAHVLYRRDKGEQVGRMDVFFKVEKWQGDIKNMESGKHDNLFWAKKDALPANTIPYVRQALDNIGKGIVFSESGW